jgi:hypothetical protein
MGLMDTLKGLVGMGRDAAAENAEKIHDVVDKAGGFIDEKTGGKYSDQIGKGAAALKGAIPQQPGAAEAEPAAQAPAPAAAPEPEAAPAAEPQAEASPAPAETASEAAAEPASEGETESAAEGEAKPESPQD